MAARVQNTKVLSVRMSIDALEAIEKAAVVAKTTRSAYAARVLFDAASGVARTSQKPAPEMAAPTPAPVIGKGVVLSDPKALEELRRIGVNINQLAHATNAGQPTDARDLARAVAAMFLLLKEPDAFMARVAKLRLDGAASKAAVPAATAPPPLPASAEPAKAPQCTPPPPTPQARRERLGDDVLPRLPLRAPPSTTHASAPSGPPLRRAPSPPPVTKPTVKEQPRDPAHSQTRNQLQDRAPIHPPRPKPATDDKPGRLGIFGQLWKR